MILCKDTSGGCFYCRTAVDSKQTLNWIKPSLLTSDHRLTIHAREEVNWRYTSCVCIRVKKKKQVHWFYLCFGNLDEVWMNMRVQTEFLAYLIWSTHDEILELMNVHCSLSTFYVKQNKKRWEVFHSWLCIFCMIFIIWADFCYITCSKLTLEDRLSTILCTIPVLMIYIAL